MASTAIKMASTPTKKYHIGDLESAIEGALQLGSSTLAIPAELYGSKEQLEESIDALSKQKRFPEMKLTPEMELQETDKAAWTITFVQPKPEDPYLAARKYHLDGLYGLIDAMNAEMWNLRQSNSILQEANEKHLKQVQAQLDEVKAKYETVQAQLKNANTELEATKARLETTSAEFKNTVASLTNEIAQKNIEIAQKDAAIVTLTMKNLELVAPAPQAESALAPISKEPKADTSTSLDKVASEVKPDAPLPVADKVASEVKPEDAPLPVADKVVSKVKPDAPLPVAAKADIPKRQAQVSVWGVQNSATEIVSAKNEASANSESFIKVQSKKGLKNSSVNPPVCEKFGNRCTTCDDPQLPREHLSHKRNYGECARNNNMKEACVFRTKNNSPYCFCVPMSCKEHGLCCPTYKACNSKPNTIVRCTQLWCYIYGATCDNQDKTELYCKAHTDPFYPYHS